MTVLDVKGNQVRLGINAPKDVAFDREEVFCEYRIEQMPKKQGNSALIRW